MDDFSFDLVQTAYETMAIRDFCNLHKFLYVSIDDERVRCSFEGSQREGSGSSIMG